MLKQSSTELFVDHSEYSIMLGRLISQGDSYELEAITECPHGDASAIRAFIGNFSGISRRAGYIPAYCSVQPESQFIYKVALEAPARAKNPTYIPGVLKEEYGLVEDKDTWRLLNSSDGQAFNPEEALQRNIICVGAKQKALDASQDRLVNLGVYPKCMELGSLSSVAGLMEFTAAKAVPTISLEMGEEHSLIGVVYKRQIELIREIPFGVHSILPVVQQELALKDEAAARKLLFSNTFDFTSKGHILLDKILEEMRASVDYYEVETGQRVQALFVDSLPKALNWVGETLSKALGVEGLPADYEDWLKGSGIILGKGVEANVQSFRLLSLISGYPGRNKERGLF